MHSEETKKKVSEGLRLYYQTHKVSEETRAKMRLKTFKHSEESKQKMRKPKPKGKKKVFIGVYKITSKIHSSHYYIGSSVNISERWRLHLLKLRQQTHHNRNLQHHFNKYGASDLQFEILQECDKCDLIRIEQYYIDLYNPCFNISPTADSSRGIKRTSEFIERMKINRSGKKDNEEIKIKKSIAQRKRRNKIKLTA